MLEESLSGENSIVLLKLPLIFEDYLKVSIETFQGKIFEELQSNAT
jgi:hypothetical protein